MVFGSASEPARKKNNKIGEQKGHTADQNSTRFRGVLGCDVKRRKAGLQPAPGTDRSSKRSLCVVAIVDRVPLSVMLLYISVIENDRIC